jgi:UDP-GlcNAc:undecaprenyl-phosphate GlcNAc-1-phosphate transferase
VSAISAVAALRVIGFVSIIFGITAPAALALSSATDAMQIALAVLGIKLDFKGIPLAVTWAIPVIILGVPIFDTTLVVISRLRRRRPIMMGGKDHTSHRLVELYGMTPARAVMTLYLVAAALGLLALLFHDASILEAQIGDALLAVGFVAALIVLEARFRAARAGTVPKDNS